MHLQLHDSGDDNEFVGHIPGSGIDFAAITHLQLIDATVEARRDVPKLYRSGIRLEGPERLVLLDGHFDAGDIVVRVRRSGDALQFGRPMQVRHALEEGAIALDDPSLGRWRRGTGKLLALDGRMGYGRAAVWHVLAFWEISRCPRCGSPGAPMLWGMPDGPGVPMRFIGGCVVQVFDGEIRCSHCTSEWDRQDVANDR
ncbi:MAG: hypothetical protein DLM57_09325 [Pseudonocardiales bacterium]|nr:MAG: hypothetical protein DLM57_09325 [Pseudonocardiales bacterium]